MRVCILFGSTSSSTEEAALRIKNNLETHHKVDVYNIYKQDIAIINEYRNIIIGCPTWDIGLLQEDWREIFPSVEKVDFTKKKIAYFGAGDQFVYPDTFLDALGILEEKITSLGGETIGYWPSEDYEFKTSRALRGNKFVGLGFDNDNEPERTNERIDKWCRIIEKEFIEENK